MHENIPANSTFYDFSHPFLAVRLPSYNEHFGQNRDKCLGTEGKKKEEKETYERNEQLVLTSTSAFGELSLGL